MTLAEVFDPHEAHDRWIREHEYHLDMVPDLAYVLVEATLPTIPVSRAGSRFDKDQITGTRMFDLSDMVDRLDTGPGEDARQFWAELHAYHQAAVGAVLTPSRPAPALPARPDPDPLSARGTTLLVVGWLIDHAEQIASAPTLTTEPDGLYAMIRHLRGRYGVFQHPRRRPEQFCDVCGEKAVRTWWASSRDGVRPRSVEVRTCNHCGSETREDDPTDV